MCGIADSCLLKKISLSGGLKIEHKTEIVDLNWKAFFIINDTHTYIIEQDGCRIWRHLTSTLHLTLLQAFQFTHCLSLPLILIGMDCCLRKNILILNVQPERTEEKIRCNKAEQLECVGTTWNQWEIFLFFQK